MQGGAGQGVHMPKPLKHYRRAAWLPWLWGQGAPWERIPTLCASCSTRHGGSVQMRPARCGAWSIFWTIWQAWWNWTSYAKTQLDTALDHEKWLCTHLLIPLSLGDAPPPPPKERHKLRSVAGLFQFRAIQGMQGLRRRLVGPTPDLPPSPLWLTRFTAQHCAPKETPRNLRNMVTSPSGARKRKRTPEHNTPVIDVDLWIQEARQANDSEVIQWFTRTVLHQLEAKTQNYKKKLQKKYCTTYGRGVAPTWRTSPGPICAQ